MKHDGLDQLLLNEGISDPRLTIEPDHLRLGFRYGSSPWSSVISIYFRVWLVPSEPNVVALELQGLHAGLLPFSAQSLLERVSDVLRQKVNVTWYRHNSNPVALVRFQSDSNRTTVQMTNLELQDGKIIINGSSLDGAPAAALPPSTAKSSPN
jgi:hypothetical protein